MTESPSNTQPTRLRVSVFMTEGRRLTQELTRAAPVIHSMEQRRHRGVECSDRVSCLRLDHLAVSSL